MAQATILWTFLPNGIKDGKLRFSAAVSIRLPEEAGPKPNLGLFPEVLEWPKTLNSMAFEVQLDRDRNVAGEAVRLSPEADLELWQAIFQPDSPVAPFDVPDLTRAPVLSFPAKHVQTFLAQQYINVAAESPEEPPAIEKMFRSEALGQVRLKPLADKRFAPVVQLRTTEQVMAQRVRSTLDTQKVKAVPPSPTPDPAQDFYLLRLYHRPRNKVVVDPKTKAAVVQKVAVKPPELDFHQALSSLTSYPALMRLLGLALDFEMPIPAKMPKTGMIRITAKGRSDRSAWTRFVFDPAKGTFAPQARASKPEVVDGFLDLRDGDKYDIIQIDVDGAALKTAELADKAEETESGDLPALRSSGLSVVKSGSAVSLAEALRIVHEIDLEFKRKRDIVLYAEDLVQGYRVDVWDDRSRAWHSLCRRVGTYSFLRLDREVTLEDEGFVSESVTQAADDSSDDMFAHEAIFTWNGWSLVAPRPGKTIDEEDKVADIQSRAATAFRLETQFKPAPASLPRLRFGTGYRLRARAVDLAGNSLPPETADDSKALPAPPEPPFTYTRFDPVPPPVLVQREGAKQGETVDDIVIRTFNDAPAKDSLPAEETAERHVVPPKTSQLLAETDGMFDGESGLRTDIYAMLAAKDAGRLEELAPGEEIELPYFPDPWAKGVVIRGLPFYPADKPLTIDYSGNWPELRTFRLRVEEGDKAAVWDKDTRVLTVFIKKADLITLRLSSYFPEPLLLKQGLYNWLEKPQLAVPPKVLQAPQAVTPILTPQVQPMTAAQVRPAQPQAKAAQAQPQVRAEVRPVFQLPKINIVALRKIALQGSHWMMTPFRTVTIVHAVQQPLGKPGAKKFLVVRGPGETHASFDASLDVHGPSSAKFDLLAEWKEPVDNINEPAWRMLEGRAHVLEAQLGRSATTFTLSPAAGHRHEFGDTKYRRVAYGITATTRYKEQMPPEIAGDPERLTRRSDPIEVDVPNSAPPALPKVLYVIPTFGWERKRELGKFTSVRKGGGLRVYLERPWFSTGDGELLAAILPPTPVPATAKPTAAAVRPGQARPTAQVKPQAKPSLQAAVALPEAFRHYVTLWGLDPVWRSGGLGTPEYPMPEDFSLAESVQRNLPLIELPDTPRFTAVGHKVFFEEERRLWYCDLELDPHDAYYPFVRLALARFQPVSVPGAHLSPVVTADFIQLAPDRTVSVSFNRSNLKELNIAVSGASYVQNAAAAGPGEIEVTLESRSLAMPEELGWTPVEKGQVKLSSQRVAGKPAGNFIWSGKLTLPGDIKVRAYRLAVREYETFVSDEPDLTARTTAAVALKKVRRLVFAETIPLLDL